MKYLSIDLETTGLDPNTNKVIMFGVVADDLFKADKNNINDLPCFSTVINQEMQGDAYALEMNKWIFDMMPEKGVSQAEFLNIFEDFLRLNDFEKQDDGKYHITVAGKNVSGFDRPFLNNMPGFKERFRIHQRCIDPTILYAKKDDQQLPDLKTCLKRAGINKEVAHSALEDALDIVTLIRRSDFF